MDMTPNLFLRIKYITTDISSFCKFKFGKSYPAFAYENLTSWGGNAVAGDENPPQYHMYTSAMSYGRNGMN